MAWGTRVHGAANRAQHVELLSLYMTQHLYMIPPVGRACCGRQGGDSMKQHTYTKHLHTHTHACTHRHAQQTTQPIYVDVTYVYNIQQFTTKVQSPLEYTIPICNSLHMTDNTAKGLISKVPPASGVTGDTVSNKVSMHP